MEIIILSLCSYFIGSIPFGLIFTKFFLKRDVRKIGSGNIGATNVLRTGNKVLALLTLIFGATWLIVLFLFRYSSLSSILASLSLIIYNLFFDDNFQNIFLILFFLIIIYTHKLNILRIKDKKETKIKF